MTPPSLDACQSVPQQFLILTAERRIFAYGK
jgi:hypothetical protein